MIKPPVLQNDNNKELLGLNIEDAIISDHQQAFIDPAVDYVNRGNVCANMGNIDRAISYYHEALKKKPNSLPALYNLGTVICDRGDIDQAIELYEQTIKIKPDFPEGFYGLGKAIKKKGRLSTAMKYFKKALHLKPDFNEARRGFNHTCRTIVPSWHFAMMNDSIRNNAYELAINKVVSKDSVVLDIGTGSGLLAMFAARAGAKRVFACERVGLIAEKAKEIVKRNGMSDIITVLNKDSSMLEVGQDMPFKADVVIAEIFDVGLIGEGVIPTINDAYARLLSPNAVCIPGQAKIFGALVESRDIYEQGRVGRISGFDMGKFNEFSSLSYFQAKLSNFPHRLISDVFEVFSFNFDNKPITSENRKINVRITEDGTCHCVAFWFRLPLAEGIYLDIGPTINSHWKQAVQLLTPAVQLQKNQDVVVLAKHDCNEVFFDLGIPVKQKDSDPTLLH